MTLNWVIFGLSIGFIYSMSPWLLQIGHSDSEGLLSSPRKQCCTLVGLNSNCFLPCYWVVSGVLTQPKSLIPEAVPFGCFFEFLPCSVQIQRCKQLKGKFYEYLFYFISFHVYVFFIIGATCPKSPSCFFLYPPPVFFFWPNVTAIFCYENIPLRKN